VPPWTLPAKFAMSGVISTVIASSWLGRFIYSNVIRNSFVKVLKLLRGRLRGPEVHELGAENSLHLSVLTSEPVKMHDACSRRGIDQSLDNPTCVAFPFAIRFLAVSASRDSCLSSTSLCVRAQSYRTATGRVGSTSSSGSRVVALDRGICSSF
jgi:hypothetical protein